MEETRSKLPGATHCRACSAPLERTLVDLGTSPPCESFLTSGQVEGGESHYPLHVRVCGECLLVQIPECLPASEIFDDYAYFSSFSTSWLEHARRFCAEVTPRFGLGSESLVVELASNDGYLLRNFVEAGIPCLGVEPSWTVAEAARKVGVETVERFFGLETAKDLRAERGGADLIVGNNVLAHVPDILDFVAGAAELLAPEGVISYEFPHLERLIEECQYDTIYHEHFCYLSLHAVRSILGQVGLEVFDVQRLRSHGGSLRVFAQRQGAGHALGASVEEVLEGERAAGLDRADGAGYQGFQPRVEASKRSVLRGLMDWRERSNSPIVAYGAPGKGNTLLNFCGIRRDLVDFAVDRNTYKHGRYTPGTRIPIHAPEALDEARPECILILPWNLRAEITAQLSHAREWGARFFVPIPEWTEVHPSV